jgi:hypothetical protein
MSEQTKQSGNNDSSFSDETIRFFLLSMLKDDEQKRLEVRLLTDDELEERVRLLELELTDDYALGRLSEKERESFEKFFLVTDERRQKFKVSKALQNYAAAQTASKKNALTETNAELSLREKILDLFSFNRPAFVFATSFALLILFVGIVWFATKNLREQSEPIIAEKTTPTPKPSPQTQTSPTPETTASPKPSPKTIQTPQEPSMPATIASFVLLPGAMRDGGEMARIKIPAGERDVVRLQLTLESDEKGIYHAELLTAEGMPVLATNKKNTNGKVVFDIPARLLKVGDYQIKLSRNGESVGRYYFRALK